MRAVVVSQPGDVDSLEVVDLPVPEPGPGEVLIEVTAAGVNRADLMQRRGMYDPPPGATQVLGLECSGSIAAVGEGVTDLPPARRCARCSAEADMPSTSPYRPDRSPSYLVASRSSTLQD